jgi:error-prone DNA polymerase
MTWLRHLTEQGARHRYGPREAPKHPRAYAQIDYELDMIDQLGFPGYFLIVWDIVRFCNEADIYCQGRGSAANSAVCYALGITKADAVGLGLLFERFLSPERDGPPDIDVDIESERREEAIQYVYRRYGRSQAAQVANVITYRPRSAVRDMGKALGASPGQVDAWAKCIDAWGSLPGAGERAAAGVAGDDNHGAGGAGGTRGTGAGVAGDDNRPSGRNEPKLVHLGAKKPPLMHQLRPDAPRKGPGEGSAAPAKAADNGPSGCNEPKLVHLGAKKPPLMHQLRPDAPRKGPGEGSAGGARSTATPASAAGASGAGGPAIPEPVLDLARQTLDFPRHLGIHSGGMVICDRPVAEVCPVEWARMADRSVLQWDKEDCARAGLVKFDMLGLGMLSALHATVDHIKVFYGIDLDLADLPQDDRVYDLLCKADTVGVFQVESRAQMATLPRLRPRTFYDIVIEVALIRPGPIQGHSVHPFLRRRNGTEKITYLHPLLERSLKKTLGVPLFQEQLMQMAIDVAGFSGAEADQLRQAMGAKRSAQRMERLRARFYAGMAARGATGPVADRIWEQMAAFANFGFPESHSVSFAYLVYSSAWLKLHYPAAFLAGLLDSQPMGFWSPQSLVLDSRRHGVEVRRPDVNASGAASVLEPTRGGVLSAAGPGNTNEDRGDGDAGGPAVRLSISYVRTIGDELAKQIAAGRPYTGMEDLIRRCGLSVPQAEALATAGAFECFGQSRREALWAAGAIAQSSPAMARPSWAPRTGVTPAGVAGGDSNRAGVAGGDAASGCSEPKQVHLGAGKEPLGHQLGPDAPRKSAGEGAGSGGDAASGCNENKLVHLRAENRPVVHQLGPNAPRKATGKDGPAEQAGAGPAEQAGAGPAEQAGAGPAEQAGAEQGPAEAGPGEVGGHQAATLAGLVTGAEAPPLPGMNPIEVNRADLWATGLSPESYPTELFRSQLKARGVVTAAALNGLRNGAVVTVGGVVTHRQRPATAKGVIFVNLEDETGLVNVICTLSVWQRYGQVARTSPALLVRGKLEKAEGAINVLAISFEALVFAGAGTLRSRDFH